MNRADNTHEASAPATGYLFQCRYALLAGLRAIPDKPNLEISIEKFDDVAFESGAEPTQLIQTKHHVARAGTLTDTSVDLWKTLLIWSKRTAEDIEAPFRVKFVLLTTGIAPDQSASSLLRISDRDEDKADKLLLSSAAKSKNKKNAQAYKAYKALPEGLRLSLLRAISVLDGSPNIMDVRDEIARQLYHAVGREHIDNLVERLEGWWFGTVIKALAANRPEAISVIAIDQRVDELREEFRRRSLPVDYKTSIPYTRGRCGTGQAAIRGSAPENPHRSFSSRIRNSRLLSSIRTTIPLDS
jgi:hypothetical protein